MEVMNHSTSELAKYALLRAVFEYVKEPTQKSRMDTILLMERYEHAVLVEQVSATKKPDSEPPFLFPLDEVRDTLLPDSSE